jgi:membrane protease YdiL (CAAX protease family)
MRWLTAHLRAHALVFDRAATAPHESAAGLRLIAIFVVLEGVVGPRAALLELLGLPAPAMLTRVPILLATALVLVRYVGGVRLAQIGLYGWRHWSASEKSYFVQMLPLAIGIFSVITASHLRTFLADAPSWSAVAALVATYLLWGFSQEVMYRGVLQTELGRRWGTAAGIVVSNIVYTFGPLHLYYVTTGPAPHAVHDVRRCVRHWLVLRRVVASLWQPLDRCNVSRHRRCLSDGIVANEPMTIAKR